MKIFCQAPAKLGILGGSTDLASFSDVDGGFVLNLAINIRTRLFLTTDSKGVFNQYPATADPKLFDALLARHMPSQTHVVSHFDANIGCGLGSSGSASVALLAAIFKSYGRTLDKATLAELAWQEEMRIGWLTGKQDHLASVYGGMNGWEFLPKEEYKKNRNLVKQHEIKRDIAEKLSTYLLLINIPGHHKNHSQQDAFKELTPRRIELLERMRDLAWEGYLAVQKENISALAECMKMSWDLKKASNPMVSNTAIDAIYDKGMKSDALCGKGLGSGGGGYFLFLVEPEKRANFIKKTGFKETDFSIDFNGVSVRTL